MVKKILTLFTVIFTMLFMLGSIPAVAGYTDEGLVPMPFEAAQPALLGSAVNLVNANNYPNATVNNADGIRSAALTGQTGYIFDMATGDSSQLKRGGAIVSWAKSGT